MNLGCSMVLVSGVMFGTTYAIAAPSGEEPSRQTEGERVYFENPMVSAPETGQRYRLAFCLVADDECGQPAADRYCRDKGYSGAGQWKMDPDIGDLSPTWMLDEQSVCDWLFCDGFLYIGCDP